jgi:hypothetical protein
MLHGPPCAAGAALASGGGKPARLPWQRAGTVTVVRVPLTGPAVGARMVRDCKAELRLIVTVKYSR